MTEQEIVPEENHDDEDVPAALERDTADGPGDDESSLPESDFESFAEADVEKEDV
jgi:hypothetical protein